MRIKDIFKEKVYVDDSKIVTLDSVIKALSEARDQGRDAYYDYCPGGKKIRLYSKDISPDSAYMQVYGVTRDAYYERVAARENDSLEDASKRAMDLTDEWIEKGKKMIFPEKYDDWEKFVHQSANGVHCGLEVEGVLRVMDELATGISVSEVLDNIADDPIACEYTRFASKVFLFAERGPEFYERVVDLDKLTPKLMVRIEEQRKENEQLALKYGKTFVKE